jgi:nucleotide-binding universal stress UspA family protein
VFKHLIVPLDGSHLAEAALPTAAHLAELLGARVTLLHIIEHRAPQEVHGERHLSDADEACAYLEEVGKRAFPPGLDVEQHVHTADTSDEAGRSGVRDVARSIVGHQGELAPDLIVMCTHGRGGLRGWLFGSIAQQVIASGTTPVLLVQPDEKGDPPPPSCGQILIPLDGDPDHEEGLPAAVALAQVCHAVLHLLVVVPTRQTLSGEQAAAARLMPGAASAMLDYTQQEADVYVRERAGRWQTASLTVTTEVRRGDPAATIVETAKEGNADLIVLGTHGTTGMDAFWAGSVTARVAGRSRVKLLLVPVRG